MIVEDGTRWIEQKIWNLGAILLQWSLKIQAFIDIFLS